MNATAATPDRDVAAREVAARMAAAVTVATIIGLDNVLDCMEGWTAGWGGRG